MVQHGQWCSMQCIHNTASDHDIQCFAHASAAGKRYCRSCCRRRDAGGRSATCCSTRHAPCYTHVRTQCCQASSPLLEVTGDCESHQPHYGLGCCWQSHLLPAAGLLAMVLLLLVRCGQALAVEAQSHVAGEQSTLQMLKLRVHTTAFIESLCKRLALAGICPPAPLVQRKNMAAAVSTSRQMADYL